MCFEENNIKNNTKQSINMCITVVIIDAERCRNGPWRYIIYYRFNLRAYWSFEKRIMFE